FFQAEDGIRDRNVTGVQTCALPISPRAVGTGEPLVGFDIGPHPRTGLVPQCLAEVRQRVLDEAPPGRTDQLLLDQPLAVGGLVARVDAYAPGDVADGRRSLVLQHRVEVFARAGAQTAQRRAVDVLDHRRDDRVAGAVHVLDLDALGLPAVLPGLRADELDQVRVAAGDLTGQHRGLRGDRPRGVGDGHADRLRRSADVDAAHLDPVRSAQEGGALV